MVDGPIRETKCCPEGSQLGFAGSCVDEEGKVVADVYGVSDFRQAYAFPSPEYLPTERIPTAPTAGIARFAGEAVSKSPKSPWAIVAVLGGAALAYVYLNHGEEVENAVKDEIAKLMRENLANQPWIPSVGPLKLFTDDLFEDVATQSEASSPINKIPDDVAKMSRSNKGEGDGAAKVIAKPRTPDEEEALFSELQRRMRAIRSIDGRREFREFLLILDPHDPLLDRLLIDTEQNQPGVIAYNLSNFIYSRRLATQLNQNEKLLFSDHLGDKSFDFGRYLIVAEGTEEQILEILDEILRSSPDPKMRQYVLETMNGMRFNQKYAFDLWMHGVLAHALFDPDENNLRLAFSILDNLLKEDFHPWLVDFVETLRDRFVDPSAPPAEQIHQLNQILTFRRVREYVAFDLISSDAVKSTGTLSLREISPHHPLADYFPYEDYENPMGKKYAEIIKLLGANPHLTREDFYRLFLKVPIKVVAFSDGQRLLLDGHARFAAMILAVERGLIPAEWLHQIPIEFYSHDLPSKDYVFIISGGVHMTWRDMHPPGTISETTMARILQETIPNH